MSLVKSHIQCHCITWSILLYCGWLSSNDITLTERGYRYPPYLFYRDYRSLWNSRVFVITLQKHKALRIKRFQVPYYNRNRRRKVIRFTLENRIQLLKTIALSATSTRIIDQQSWPGRALTDHRSRPSIITVIDLWHLPHDTSQLPLLYNSDRIFLHFFHTLSWLWNLRRLIQRFFKIRPLNGATLM